MFYKFTDDKNEIIGLVGVEPADDAGVAAKIVSVDPPEFEEYLENEVFQASSHFLDILGNPGTGGETPEPEASTVFDKTRMDHWWALPKIFNVRNGYGGAEEYTDEEIQAALGDLLEPADADSSVDEGEGGGESEAAPEAAPDDKPDEVAESGEPRA